MSKIYDLYPSYERKIDNWRKRILGYEKMKKDMQRQIQILKNKNKKQKEINQKAIEYIKERFYFNEETGEYALLHTFDKCNVKELLDILNEVSK